MLVFNALDSFLEVRPSFDKNAQQVNAVLSPFVLPSGTEPLRAVVCELGRQYLVHDDGLTKKAIPHAERLVCHPDFAPIREKWIQTGVSLDEEGRLFIVSDADTEALKGAIANLFEAAMVLATAGVLIHSAPACPESLTVA